MKVVFSFLLQLLMLQSLWTRKEVVERRPLLVVVMTFAFMELGLVDA